ncbi:MAG: hypothetical protein WA220_08460 [Candidatus Nitrosopolaris sp.]|jgi:hypothetical protein
MSGFELNNEAIPPRTRSDSLAEIACTKVDWLLEKKIDEDVNKNKIAVNKTIDTLVTVIVNR